MMVRLFRVLTTQGRAGEGGEESEGVVDCVCADLVSNGRRRGRRGRGGEGEWMDEI